MPSPCYRMGIAIEKIPEVTRVGITKLEQQLETYKKKIKIMEHALSSSAGAYYNINITQNLVPGTMYQVIDDVEYSINEAIGFPDDCRYWDVIE